MDSYFQVTQKELVKLKAMTEESITGIFTSVKVMQVAVKYTAITLSPFLEFVGIHVLLDEFFVNCRKELNLFSVHVLYFLLIANKFISS